MCQQVIDAEKDMAKAKGMHEKIIANLTVYYLRGRRDTLYLLLKGEIK
jgi:hypothetical protein